MRFKVEKARTFSCASIPTYFGEYKSDKCGDYLYFAAKCTPLFSLISYHTGVGRQPPKAVSAGCPPFGTSRTTTLACSRGDGHPSPCWQVLVPVLGLNLSDNQLVRLTGKVLYPTVRTTAVMRRMNDSTLHDNRRFVTHPLP